MDQVEGQENRLLRAESRGLMSRKSFCGSSGSMSQLFRPEYSSSQSQANQEVIWNLMGEYQATDTRSIQKSIVNHIEFSLARTRFDFSKYHCYQALSRSLRDRLIESFNDTQLHFNELDVKRVYYLSLEFMIGRCLQNAVINLGLEDQYGTALRELGYGLEELYDQEGDPALGNGGLGRLAACFMDSLATMNYPAWGYGIRYSYGIFKQLIQQGYQVEVSIQHNIQTPDYWLDDSWPWEIERNDVQYQIRFYGTVVKRWEQGKERCVWEGGERVLARAYDIPIPGYMTFNTIGLRLWRSLPASEFDFGSFNSGDHFKSFEARQRAEYITAVLYPNDSTQSGKELRLKQQYLLVSATLQDIIRRFKKKKKTWAEFHNFSAIQLNDTHPALGIIELLRILIDLEGLEHPEAWEIVYKTFGYTNHTVLPEALEKWGVDLIGNLLPRHLEIIYLVNMIFLEKVAARYPGDFNKMSSMSIIEEGHQKKVRMANLCIIGSHNVNGVAAIHSDLLKKTLFKDFFEMRPKKFMNKTNGVTPRRWLRACNKELSALYDRLLETDEWTLDMEMLKKLEPQVENDSVLNEFMKIKRNNKLRLVQWVRDNCKIEVDHDSLFDIQVKRIHEYKRQFMNILYVIHRYLLLKAATPEVKKQFVPRTVFFGGKAAPGYQNAKRIIKLINSVSDVVNTDHETNQLLKVVFLPNYRVSSAEIIIPASDISEHISTAGTEASGTSNMKFVMNGGIIIGTWDGANIEIAEEVGLDNIFIFGAKIEEIEQLTNQMRSSEPEQYIGKPLMDVINAVRSGVFGDVGDLNPLLDSITYRNDYYLVAHDFYEYSKAQLQIDKLYKNKKDWAKKAMLNSLRSGKFSSDRTIREYATEIWGIEPCEIPKPAQQSSERRKSIIINPSSQQQQ